MLITEAVFTLDNSTARCRLNLRIRSFSSLATHRSSLGDGASVRTAHRTNSDNSPLHSRLYFKLTVNDSEVRFASLHL